MYFFHAFRESFIDKLTNETLREGQLIRRRRLAKTLEIIARQGGDVLHNGTLLKGFIKDIRDHGGILTEEDMQKYELVLEKFHITR